MTAKSRGLGRNLSALLGQNAAATAVALDKPRTEDIFKCAVSAMQPGKYQPRAAIEDAPLHDLAESIKKQGVLQPILVREIAPDRYEIIAGERRWRASQLAGLDVVPVLVKDVDDETAMAMALVENLQREDLNAMDQARAMHRLTEEFGLTHQQVADLVSKSRAAVSNFLRLLSLSTAVMKLLEHGDLDMGHARALLQLNEEQQVEAAQIVVAKNLSVRETEQLVARIAAGKREQAPTWDRNQHYQNHITELSKHLKTKVKLKANASGKGSLVIHFSDEKTLDNLLAHLKE